MKILTPLLRIMKPHRDGPEGQFVIESTTDAIVTIDEQSRICFANPAAERIFGYANEEMVGQEITLLMPEQYRKDHRAGVSSYLATGRRHIEWTGVQVNGLHKDGHTIPLEISFGEYLQDGEHLFSGIIRDITEQHQAIEHLRHAKEAAETREQQLVVVNEAKDRFIAIESHELRTPLTPVMTALEALQSEHIPENLRPWIEIIRRNIQLEARLVDDLFDLTRISKGKLRLRRELVDIHCALGDVLSMYTEELQERNLRIETAYSASEHHVEGDPDRLKQVFWNLIKNAMKFTPDGGAITIRTRNDGGTILIAMQDTGIGIAPEFLSKIFEAFQQGDAPSGHGGGIGLGLAICKDLIEAHGGTIRAASGGKGKGSTFTVQLKTSLPAGPVVSTNGHSKRTPEHGSTILLIDDHADLTRAVGMVLERHGYLVRTAKSGEEAIREVMRCPVDLIISDIGLPDESGLKLLPKLREVCNVPAIALSGFGGEEDIGESLAAGFQEHVTKPFDLQYLMDTIATLLGKKDERNAAYSH